MVPVDTWVSKCVHTEGRLGLAVQRSSSREDYTSMLVGSHVATRRQNKGGGGGQPLAVPHDVKAYRAKRALTLLLLA